MIITLENLIASGGQKAIIGKKIPQKDLESSPSNGWIELTSFYACFSPNILLPTYLHCLHPSSLFYTYPVPLHLSVPFHTPSQQRSKISPRFFSELAMEKDTHSVVVGDASISSSPSQTTVSQSKHAGMDSALAYIQNAGSNGDEATGASDKSLLRKIDWRIVPIMFACYTMQFVDKVLINVSPFLFLFLSLLKICPLNLDGSARGEIFA